ncbi:MAG: hypothetical protein AAFS00_09375, partial [Bacteroidota bacterium]
MDWLNDIKDRFSKRRMRSLDRTKEYSRDFVDLESANRIGVILNTSFSPESDLRQIQEYIKSLQQRSKRLVVIEINANKKSEPSFSQYPDYIFINPTKLNWLDYPTPAIENQIRKHELDILMDFDLSVHMTSKYICSMARAKTRTGVHREGFESCYELMINQVDAKVLGLKAMIKEFD